MKLKQENKIVCNPYYFFNSDYSKIITLEEGQRRAYANALAATPTIPLAAYELGVSTRNVHRFISEESLDSNIVAMMRINFLMSGKKVKSKKNEK